MRRLYLCRAFAQPAVLTRSPTGLALTFHAMRQVWAPALYQYCVGWEVKEARGVRNWTLVIVDDGASIDAAASSDPDIRDLPAGLTLNSVLTTQQRNVVQTRFNNTDLGITVPAGATVRDVLRALGVALGHHADFTPDRFVG